MNEVKSRTDVAGRVWKIVAAQGGQVAAGDTLMIVESMKMEIPIVAPATGVLTRILVAEGELLSEDQVVALIRS